MSWTENLIAGDKVVYRHGSWHDPQIKLVDRITKTQIIIKGISYRFRRSDGHAIGRDNFGRWTSPPGINEYTKEAAEAIKAMNERKDTLNKISKIVWNDINVDKLKAVLDLVMEHSQ